ncbi:MAG: sigma-70 family RNA polymerase sigma factor [Clostridia bacterium]|nr:sigma-70 family RNA polymerase sigma factor [Clostridia bacterium]
MAHASGTPEALIADFTENYMEKLFYFCLKKTGNSLDAEDLTQDIALHILTGLNKGTIPVNFPAWVWQIARNRYAVWADRKHKKADAVTGTDIGDYEIADETESTLDTMIREEQLSALRRELAFIEREYRNVIVAYYIEDKSVREIAAALSLSVPAVKQRLYRARNILKEGMSMAREFGKRSYKPEQVTFVMNGKSGTNGQPWSIITHSMYKNIFLETYENPQTAEEISLALGIALPYMEDELAFLVREQLLRKNGNKYQPDFPIISREEQLREHELWNQLKKPVTEKLCLLIDTYMKAGGAKVNASHIGYDAAKWALLVRTFDWFINSVHTTGSSNIETPVRPDDGAWTLTGYESIDWEEPAFVGMHTVSYDESEGKKYINFGQYKFFYNNIHTKTPIFLTWHEAYTLWLVCTENTETCEKNYLEKMLEYGYIKQENAEILPNVLIIDANAKETYSEAVRAELRSLRDEIADLLAKAPNTMRGYIVEQAIADGWLKDDEATPATIGAYMYLE